MWVGDRIVFVTDGGSAEPRSGKYISRICSVDVATGSRLRLEVGPFRDMYRFYPRHLSADTAGPHAADLHTLVFMAAGRLFRAELNSEHTTLPTEIAIQWRGARWAGLIMRSPSQPELSGVP